eukprot:1160040-Pelagomonas_calceolata.AAC.5
MQKVLGGSTVPEGQAKQQLLLGHLSLDGLRCSGQSYREQACSVAKEKLPCLGPAQPPHAHGTAPEGTASLSILMLVQLLIPGPKVYRISIISIAMIFAIHALTMVCDAQGVEASNLASFAGQNLHI